MISRFLPRLFISILFLFILIFSFSCSGNKRKKEVQNEAPDMEALIEMNRNLINSDIEKIESYIKDNSLEMIKTGTGLYYGFEADVDGNPVKENDIVHFSYRISELDGELFYDSKIDGVRSFEIDKSEVESGWNEAAKLMSPGDSLIAIMPPHLAFRNIGDQNKIGPGKTLIYELRLDSVD